MLGGHRAGGGHTEHTVVIVTLYAGSGDDISGRGHFTDGDSGDSGGAIQLNSWVQLDIARQIPERHAQIVSVLDIPVAVMKKGERARLWVEQTANDITAPETQAIHSIPYTTHVAVVCASVCKVPPALRRFGHRLAEWSSLCSQANGT